MCELIDSEIDYIGDLKLCRDAYILPLGRVSSGIDDIFIGWPKLIQAHEKHAHKIINNRQDYALVLSEFMSLLTSITKLYIEICTEQSECMRRCEMRLASDIRFKQLVNECRRKMAKSLESMQQASLEQSLIDLSLDESAKDHDTDSIKSSSSRIQRNQGLPLMSFILKPTQRITKYSLLFERMLKETTRCSSDQHVHQIDPRELRPKLSELLQASSDLCQRVNEACREREDSEENLRRLHWAQVHIRQTVRSTNTEPIDPVSHDMRLPTFGEQSHHEYIEFESRTNCLGERQLVKAGSLFKEHAEFNTKEIIAFMFNDILILCQTKGKVALKVEDIFKSERAKQTYYKLYREPILMEDVIVMSRDSRSSVASCPEAKFSFTDKRTGKTWTLSAINSAETDKWSEELSKRSMAAREARARINAQLDCKSICRTHLSECYARLFVTIIELHNLRAYLSGFAFNASATALRASMRRGTKSSDAADIIRRRLSSSSDLRDINKQSMTSKICVQLQTRRLRTTRSDAREMVATSELFKTAIYAINTDDLTSSDQSSLTSESGCMTNNAITAPIIFYDETTQFLMKRKEPNIDLSDILDICLRDEPRFKESQLLARRRVDLDSLIEPSQTHDSAHECNDNDSTSATCRIVANRPVDLCFKLKPSNDLRSSVRYSNSQRDSYSPALDVSIASNDSASTSSLSNRPPLMIKIRFHLHIFQ